MRIDNLHLVGKMSNVYKSGFSVVRQDLSGKFGCPVLSGQETHMSVRSSPTAFHERNYFYNIYLHLSNKQACLFNKP